MNTCIYKKDAIKHLGHPRRRWIVCKKCLREADLNYRNMVALDDVRAFGYMQMRAERNWE